jgi:hypothetical protein
LREADFTIYEKLMACEAAKMLVVDKIRTVTGLGHIRHIAS